jgi:hypothetical protein
LDWQENALTANKMSEALKIDFNIEIGFLGTDEIIQSEKLCQENLGKTLVQITNFHHSFNKSIATPK